MTQQNDTSTNGRLGRIEQKIDKFLELIYRHDELIKGLAEDISTLGGRIWWILSAVIIAIITGGLAMFFNGR